ncbi:MAG: EMC3/TMCO1 family protein [Candidatus Woesearchaeota archaeon]
MIETIGGVVSSIVDPILLPLASISPLFAIIVISLFVSLVHVFLQKKLVDQHKVKAIREKMSKLQKKMRASKDDPQKMMKLHKQIMQSQGQLFPEMIKPAFVTMIPLLILFAWIATHLVYVPLQADEPFSVSVFLPEYVSGSVFMNSSTFGEQEQGLEPARHGFMFKRDYMRATFELSGDVGEHNLTFTHKEYELDQRVRIDPSITERTPDRRVNEGVFQIFRVNYEKMEILPLGFTTFAGIGAYIVFSLIFSLTFRKLFKLA